MRSNRIVLTGGPGGGKTTAADLFRREIGAGVVIVPESATMLFTGGFPRSKEIEVVKATQRAIYHVQKNLEDVQACHFKDRVLLCDRGTIDGAAYWPLKEESFFDHMGTTLELELNRYDHVIYFESAAVGGISIEGGNPTRNESIAEACALENRLKGLWQQHPHFHFVGHNESFMEKINQALRILYKLVIKN